MLYFFHLNLYIGFLGPGLFVNERLCFLVSGLLVLDFSMKVFAFLVPGIVEDGAVLFFYS